MSLATDTRDIVHERPYLLTALRAGVVNYAATAAEFDLDDDEAVTITLRRFAVDLPPLETDPRDAVITMRSGIGLVGEDVEVIDDEPMLSVASVDLTGDDPLTTIIAESEVDPAVLAAVLFRLDAESVVIDAADVAGDTLAVVVPHRQRVTALRAVETTVSDLYV